MECAYQRSLPCAQPVADTDSVRSSRSLLPLPAMLLSPGWVYSRTPVEPSRAVEVRLARLPAACSEKPHSVGELEKLQERVACAMAGEMPAKSRTTTAA